MGLCIWFKTYHYSTTSVSGRHNHHTNAHKSFRALTALAQTGFARPLGHFWWVLLNSIEMCSVAEKEKMTNLAVYGEVWVLSCTCTAV